MMLPNPNKESPLDALEHELYDPKKKPEETGVHGVHRKRELSLPTSWGEDSPVIVPLGEDKGFSFGIKLLFVSLIALIAALSFTAWRVFSLRNVVSQANIDMVADVSPYVEGGEALPLILTVRNRNQSVLQEVKVTMSYKQGNGAQDELEKIQEKRDMGTIAINEYKKQDYSIIMYGSAGETRDISLKLEYKVAGSNAIFNKVLSTSVVLKTPPISVSISGEETLSIGQNGTFVFSVVNNSATTTLPSVLQLTPPTTFTQTASNPQLLSRTTSWKVDPLKPGESQKFSLTGYFSGKEGEIATFQAKIGSRGESEKNIGIVYAVETRDVRLRASPLEVSFVLTTDRTSSENLKYGDRARVEVTYTNSSLLALQDVSVVLSLSGDAPIYNQIDPTEGYYDSIAKTITWNKAVLPDLAVIPPGGQGRVLVFIPIIAKGTNSPKLNISLVGKASSKADDDIVVKQEKGYTVYGSASLEAKTLYKTASFATFGPVPPRANTETLYAVNLSVRSQNALSSTKVSFVLPVYVSWVDSSTDKTGVSYNETTRTVTWNIGQMAEGDMRVAEVGLVVKPSQSHVGKTPTITSSLVLEADEVDSRTHLKTTLSPLTVKVKEEGLPADQGVVQP